MPFISHQYSAYRLFCTSAISTTAPWCASFPPSVYTYVQAKYWNVGFLRYWTPEQLPNFALGAPPLVLLSHAHATTIAALPNAAAPLSASASSARPGPRL